MKTALRNVASIYRHKKRYTFMFGVLFCFYTWLLYKVLDTNWKNDFFCFYNSAKNLLHHLNPYVPYDIPGKFENMPINYNPPFTIITESILALFSRPVATALWILLSLGAVSIGYKIVLTLLPQKALSKKYPWFVFLCVLSSTCVIKNALTGQMGNFLFLLLIAGYYFYQQKKDLPAGIFWGILTSLKFFPALLLIYSWQKNRARVAYIMLITIVVCSSFPYFIYGSAPYFQYIAALKTSVIVINASWNASILGLMARLTSPTSTLSYYSYYHVHNLDLLFPGLAPLKYSYIFILFCSLIAYFNYLKRDNDTPENHQSFNFTICLMLLLSPLGWNYYFPMLILPVLSTWESMVVKNQTAGTVMLWLGSIALLNFSTDFRTPSMSTFSVLYEVGYHSSACIGLLLLTYLTLQTPSPQKIRLLPLKTAINFLFFIIAMGIVSCLLWPLCNTLAGRTL
ncbi:MAG: glycosyltransferase family 87 protein [Legionellaceae bacterium]|nr:glycosyltransferase family 87 protein [Legionellaceae bacterium]